MHQAYIDIMSDAKDVHFELLPRDCPNVAFEAAICAAHAYQTVAARDELDVRHRAAAPLLDRAPHLLVVSSNGAGYDTVDVDACTEAGVLVLNQAGVNAEAVAEHALGMILSLSKSIAVSDKRMRREIIRSRVDLMGNDIAGKTLGIIGLGHVGRRLAQICRDAFRMRVMAYDPYLTAEEIQEAGAEKVPLETLLAAADYIVVSCPLTAETQGMIGHDAFAAMKKGAYFVTTARGGIHDEAALAEALAAGWLAGAGVDVWACEPPPLDHPLMKFENVVMSPHIAGVTKDARLAIARHAALQLLDTLAGGVPRNLVNPQAWSNYAKRFKCIMGFTPGERDSPDARLVDKLT